MTLIENAQVVEEDDMDSSVRDQVSAINQMLRLNDIDHGDLEGSDNILLDKDGKVWRIDFGRAVFVNR